MGETLSDRRGWQRAFFSRAVLKRIISYPRKDGLRFIDTLSGCSAFFEERCLIHMA